MAGPLADFIRRDFRFRPLADLGIHSRVGRRLAAIVAADVAGYSRQVRGKVAVEFPVAVSTSCPVMRTPSIAVLPFTNMSGIIGDDIRSRILTDAVADRRLLEMLSINCHRAFIAKALDRTEMEIRERVGVLKALRASGENFMGCLAAADEMPLLRYGMGPRNPSRRQPCLHLWCRRRTLSQVRMLVTGGPPVRGGRGIPQRRTGEAG
jgi:hypothetical protein